MNRSSVYHAIKYLMFAGIAMLPNLCIAQPPGRGGPPGGGGPGGGPPTEMIMQLFTQADANGNGCVTKSELTAAMQRMGQSQGRGGPGGQQFGQQNQGQGNQQGQGPPNGPPNGQQGPPPRAGEVLPEQIATSLALTVRQKRLLTALQKDVDKRLAAILTDEQEVKLQGQGPPPEFRGPGGGNERPQFQN